MSDNPSAFPTPPASFSPMGDMAFAEEGMTLRDWFAGQFAPVVFKDLDWRDRTAKMVAARSYALADAMLSARKDAPHA